MTNRTEKLSITNARVSAFRLRRHHLDRRAPRGELPKVVGDTCGVQAQVTAMARIALWARLQSLTIDDVDRALMQEQTITKVWSMRGALHLHPSKELPTILGGLMPTRLRLEERWIRGAGLKEEETTAMVLRALEHGPLTRAQLVDYLGKQLGAKTKDWRNGGWGRQTAGAATTWQLVKPAVIRGLVCFGPSNGQEITFVKVDQWIRETPPMPSEAEAEEALVRRYLQSFGPADAQDLQAWSGIRDVRRIRAILERLGDELVRLDRDGRPGFLLRKDVADLEKGRTDPGVVQLLPSFDPYMLGHRDRAHLIDRARYKQVYRAQGWLAPVVLLDGRVAGIWSYQRKARNLDVAVKMFTSFSKETRTKLEEEAHELSRFLEAQDLAFRIAE